MTARHPGDDLKEVAETLYQTNRIISLILRELGEYGADGAPPIPLEPGADPDLASYKRRLGDLIAQHLPACRRWIDMEKAEASPPQSDVDEVLADFQEFQRAAELLLEDVRRAKLTEVVSPD